jgi:DNA repair exonuclease SbcCD nuclease subunit
MKFAHLADCHLGSWRQPELQELNIQSFKKAIEICIEEQVEFILFTGDLFDSAFPPIEILKETFSEFRKLKEAKIKSYVIAGSHDYSVSGKTFLDVLERAGFCEICKSEEKGKDEDKEIILKPLIHKSYHIYGYSGKKSGLEIQDLKKIKILEPYESNFRILMLHTTIKDVAENLPIETINLSDMPKADYYALGHIHVNYEKEVNGKPAIYGGPTFPNNFKELEELKNGSFYIIDVEGYTKITRKEINLKQVEFVEIQIDNALTGTEKIISILERKNLKNKIVLLKIYGTLNQGKNSDIKFQQIQEYLEKQGVYSFLKNTSKLEIEKQENLQIKLETKEMEKVEESLIKEYEKENPSNLNELIFPLMEALSIEKQEGEKNTIFEQRLFSATNKILGTDL